MLKPRTLTLKIAERITRLKQILCGNIEFNIQDPHFIK